MCKGQEILKKLSPIELANLINDYQDTTISVRSIIEKYDLEVPISGLSKILPPVKADQLCPFCNKNMSKKLRRTRLASSEPQKFFCETCGHIIYIGGTGNKSCACENCEKAKAEIDEERRLKIKTALELEQNKISKYELSEISLKEHFFIYDIIGATPIIDINEGIIGPIPLWKLLEEYTNLERVRDLTDNSILLLSAKTPVVAFSDGPPFKYNIYEVYFTLNINDAPNIIRSIKKHSYFKDFFSIDENIEFLKYLMHEDLILSMHKKMNKRNLNLYVSTTASEILYNLLDKLSYAQLDYLCYKSASFYSDKVITKSMPKEVAERMALKTVYSYYEKFQENGWTIHKSKLFDLGERLRFFVEEALGKNIEILNYVPTKELFVSEEFNLNMKFRKEF